MFRVLYLRLLFTKAWWGVQIGGTCIHCWLREQDQSVCCDVIPFSGCILGADGGGQCSPHDILAPYCDE
jgi:hypothetical protein